MKVLIGIITRNRASLLPKAIASALAQDYPSKEVAVLDIASTDETPAIRASFPQVRWERLEERVGIPESRNRLMSQTDATYFLSLDDDAWFLRRDEISLGVKFLEANPGFAAVAYDILLPGDKPQPQRGQPRECGMFMGCGHLLRLRDIAALGYYAPNPTVYGGSEELDLCMRLHGHGRKTIFLPGAHIWHERSATGRNVQEQFSHNLCNEFVFKLRRWPIPDFFLAVGHRLLSLFSFAARHGRIKAYFKGVFLFLQAWPQVTSSREPLSRSDFRSFMKLKRRGPY